MDRQNNEAKSANILLFTQEHPHMINPIFVNKYNEDAFARNLYKMIIPSLSFRQKQSEVRIGFKSIQQIAEVSENKLDLVVL